VPGVSDEKDHPSDSEISLLGADSTLECLDVVDSSFGLDHRPHGESIDNGVGASSITGDRYGHFSPPTETRWQPSPQPLEQGQVGGVADWDSIGVKRDVQLQAEDRRHPRRELDRQLRWHTPFGLAYPRM